MSAYLKSVAVQCDVTQLIGYDLFRAPAYDNMLHIITGATTCYLHRRLYVARPHITAGISCYVHKSECVCVCALRARTSHGGTICFGHRHVHVRLHITKCTVFLRALASVVCCEITHHREHEYDLLRASASVCWETTHHRE